MPRKKTNTQNEDVDRLTPLESKPSKKGRFGRNLTPLIVLLFVVILIGIFARNYLLSATVNGQLITRFQVISELEKQSGKKALDSIITETLIFQEAKKRSIIITEKDVKDQLSEIEKSLKATGQNLDQALEMQGLTKSSLEKQIRLQKILEKIVGDNIKISNKEIDIFVKNNKNSIPDKSDMKKIRAQVEEQLKRDKINEKIQKWITDAQKKAKIIYLYKY